MDRTITAAWAVVGNCPFAGYERSMNRRIRSRTLVPRHPEDDEETGIQLVAAVHRALKGGGAPPVAVAVAEQRIDLFPADSIRESSLPPGLFLAGLSRSEGSFGRPICVGLMGTFGSRERPGVKQAMVYLEWSDCRWWLWRGLLDTDGGLMPDTESVLRAADGDTKPMAMGGWWSLGRRSRMKVRLDTRTEATVH